jgi:hypothetical protein
MTAIVLQLIFRSDTDVVHITTNGTEMHIYNSDIRDERWYNVYIYN